MLLQPQSEHMQNANIFLVWKIPGSKVWCRILTRASLTVRLSPRVPFCAHCYFLPILMISHCLWNQLLYYILITPPWSLGVRPLTALNINEGPQLSADRWFARNKLLLNAPKPTLWKLPNLDVELEYTIVFWVCCLTDH